MFIKDSTDNPGDSIMLLLWVDDILGWSTNDKLINELETAVSEKYGDSRLSKASTLQYIGMTITQPNRRGVVYVNQQEYTRKIVTASGVTGTSPSPNHAKLFRADDSRKGVPVDKTTFASHLMMAMYLAKRTRPDTLTALSILATRVQTPDHIDRQCLDQVFKYINGTSELGLTFKPTTMELHYWVDASYGVHADRRAHSGMMATLGYANAPMYVKSCKQKLHTRSSTEAELVALDDCFLHLLWLRQIIEFMGYPQNPAFVYQDNKSTIFVCETGHSKNGRLKHMAVRYFFIHGQIELNIAKIKYCRTADMVADILTKPLMGSQFQVLRNKLLNVS